MNISLPLSFCERIRLQPFTSSAVNSVQSPVSKAGCWITTGEYDILLNVRAKDMPDLAETLLKKIQKIKGMLATVSWLVLDESR